jgi:hypothetical protein
MSSFISLEEAIKMTTDYRDHRESILQAAYQGKNILCISETFEKSQVETVINQSGCVGLRVYYGMDAELKVHAIIVGVDEKNQDITGGIFSKNAVTTRTTTDFGSILENGQRCPEECPPSSPLNP